MACLNIGKSVFWVVLAVDIGILGSIHFHSGELLMFSLKGSLDFDSQFLCLISSHLHVSNLTDGVFEVFSVSSELLSELIEWSESVWSGSVSYYEVIWNNIEVF